MFHASDSGVGFELAFSGVLSAEILLELLIIFLGTLGTLPECPSTILEMQVLRKGAIVSGSCSLQQLAFSEVSNQSDE